MKVLFDLLSLRRDFFVHNMFEIICCVLAVIMLWTGFREVPFPGMLVNSRIFFTVSRSTTFIACTVACTRSSCGVPHFCFFDCMCFPWNFPGNSKILSPHWI